MITLSENEKKGFALVKIIAFALLCVAPLAYFAFAWNAFKVDPAGRPAQDLLFYMLLLVAIGTPALAPLIQRVQMSTMNKADIAANPAKLYTTMSITKFAMVDAIYIYGLAVFFMTGDFERMLYFYPIGIIWSFIYWPREEKFKSFLEKAKTPGAGV